MSSSSTRRTSKFHQNPDPFCMDWLCVLTPYIISSFGLHFQPNLLTAVSVVYSSTIYSTVIDSPTRTEVHPFLPFRMYHFETQCISWNKIRSYWRVGWLFHSSFSSAPGSHSTSIPGTRLSSNWIESRIDSTPPYVSIPAAEIACSRAPYRR